MGQGTRSQFSGTTQRSGPIPHVETRGQRLVPWVTPIPKLECKSSTRVALLLTRVTIFDVFHVGCAILNMAHAASPPTRDSLRT
jgi:hypothetical protein